MELHEDNATGIKRCTEDVAETQKLVEQNSEARVTPSKLSLAHSSHTFAPTIQSVRYPELSADTWGREGADASNRSRRLLRSIRGDSVEAARKVTFSQEEEDVMRDIEGQGQASERELDEIFEEFHGQGGWATSDRARSMSPLSQTPAFAAASAAAAAAAAESESVHDVGWQSVGEADTRAQGRSVWGELAIDERAGLGLVGPRVDNGDSLEEARGTKGEGERYSGVCSGILSSLGGEQVEEWDGDYEGEDVEAYTCVLLCGGLSLRHPLRRACLTISCSPVVNWTFLFANIACCSLLALVPDLLSDGTLIDGRNFDYSSNVLRVVEVAFLILLVVEMAVGLVAWGFLGRGSWLRRSNFHVLDAAIFCFSILDLGMRTFGGPALIPVHSLRFLRIFKSFSRLPGFSAGRALLMSLDKAVSQLLLVLALVLVFFLGFAAYGISSFQANFSQRCVYFERHVPSCASSQFGAWEPPCDPRHWRAQVTDSQTVPALTGGFPFERACKVYHTSDDSLAAAKLPRDPAGLLHTCQVDEFRAGQPVTQMCAPLENPGNGFAHFDHIGGALLTVATCAMLPESAGLLHIALESYAKEEMGAVLAVYLFFLFIFLLCSSFLFSLFVVIVAGTYNSAEAHTFEVRAERLRRRRKRHAFRKRVRELEAAARGVEGKSVESEVAGATRVRGTTEEGETYMDPEGSMESSDSEQGGGDTVGNKSRPVRRVSKHSGFWKGRPPPPPSLHWAASDAGKDHMGNETSGCMPQLRLKLEQWFEHQVHGHFVTIIICLQVATIGVTQDSLWSPNYDIIQCFCTGAFGVEALLRLASGRAKGLGLQYFIECAGILIGVIGLVMHKRIYVVAPAILRAYRLIGYFPALQYLMQSTVLATHALLQLMLLLLLFVISAAVAGRYLVNATMEGRDHFATLPHSLRTAFIIFSGDNWAKLMFNAMASKTTASGQILVAGYFLLWVGFSVFVLFNLAVAVMINHVEISKLVQVIEGPGLKMAANQMVRRSYGMLYNPSQDNSSILQPDDAAQAHSLTHTRSPGLLWIESLLRDRIHQDNDLLQICRGSVVNCREAEQEVKENIGNEGGGGGERIPPLLAAMIDVLQKQSVDKGPGLNERIHGADGEIKCGEEASETRRGAITANRLKSGRQASVKGLQSGFLSHEQSSELLSESQVLKPRYDHSYFMFSSQNCIRKACISVYHMNSFKLLVNFAVLTSCILAAVLPAHSGTYSQENLIQPHVGFMLHRACLGIFTMEFLIKSVSKNLLIGPTAYLKSGWNKLDFYILVLDWVTVIGELSSNSWGFTAGRSARALSAIRAIPRNDGIRVLIESFLRTLVPMTYVLVFQILNTLLWAFLARELFSARLHSCSGPGAEFPKGKSMCTGTFVSASNEAAQSPFLMPRAWIPPQLHFESVYDAFLAMLSCSALQWVEIMHNCADITEQDISPSQDANWQATIFFVAWLLFGHFLIINLFLAFIVQEFKIKDGLTNADAHMHRYQRQIKVAYFSLQDPEAAALKNPASRALRTVILSAAFDMFSTFCIVLNVIFLLGDHANKSAKFEDFLQLASSVFWLLLCGEMLLHLLAQGPKCFMVSYWMLFDLCVTIGISVAYASGSSLAMRRAQCLRLVRILKALAKFKQFRVILEALLTCLPQLGNVIGLLSIGLYFFTVLGVSWFGQTRGGKRLGRTSNFSSFTESAHTIFQLLLTGDDWHVLMRDCMVQPPYCTADLHSISNTDCGWPFAPAYFVAFRWLCESLILNLLIGIVFNNFTFLTDHGQHVDTPDWRNGASLSQVIEAAKVFRTIDRCRGFIPLTSVRRLLFSLEQPLGFRKPDGGVEYKKRQQITYLLIRAELNLLAVQNAQDAAEHARRFLGKLKQMLANALGSHVLKANESAVSYTQVMVTLWCWQKPEFVSNILRRKRRRTLQLIYATANALKLASFLRDLVAERQKRYFHAHLQWSRSDAAYKRRASRRHLDTQLPLLLARARQGFSAGRLSCAQIQARRVENGEREAWGFALRSIEKAPRLMVAQHSLVAERWRAESVFQESGCEVATDKHLQHKAFQLFFDQAAAGRVVLQVIDKSDLDGAMFLADFSGYSWNGWGVRGHALAGGALAIVTERDFNRDGSQNVLGGEEDGAGPDVSIVASSTALRRASGEVHTRVEDPQGQDTWFEPQCRTSSKTTDLARPKRRCGGRLSRRIEPSDQKVIGQESSDLLQLWVTSGIKGMKLLGTLTDLQCFCTVKDEENELVEELLNYGALPPVAPQVRRSTVIRLNLSRPTKCTIVPAFTSGARLAARPFDSSGGINTDSATCSSDVTEAAETLVMEVLGYCDQPEGWEDRLIDEHLGSDVADAAVKAFSSAVQSISVGQPGEMALSADGNFIGPPPKSHDLARAIACEHSTVGKTDVDSDEPGGGGVLYRATFRHSADQECSTIASSGVALFAEALRSLFIGNEKSLSDKGLQGQDRLAGVEGRGENGSRGDGEKEAKLDAETRFLITHGIKNRVDAMQLLFTGVKGEMEPASIQAVCRFLQSELGMEKNVVARFRVQHVDAHVVCACSPEELTQLGITTLGQKKKLLSFCTMALKREKELKYFGTPEWQANISPPKLSPPKFNTTNKKESPQRSPPQAWAHRVSSTSPKLSTLNTSPSSGGEGENVESDVHSSITPPAGVPPGLVSSAQPKEMVARPPATPRPLHAFPNACPNPPKDPYRYPGRSPSTLRSRSVLSRKEGNGEEGTEQGGSSVAHREAFFGQHEKEQGKKEAGGEGNIGGDHRRGEDDADNIRKQSYLGRFEEGIARKMGVIFPITEEDGRSRTASTGRVSISRSPSDAAGGRGDGEREDCKGSGAGRVRAIGVVDANYLEQVMARAGSRVSSSSSAAGRGRDGVSVDVGRAEEGKGEAGFFSSTGPPQRPETTSRGVSSTGPSQRPGEIGRGRVAGRVAGAVTAVPPTNPPSETFVRPRRA